MMDGYEKLLREFSSLVGNSSDEQVYLKLMELKRLDRIADALEKINSNLSSMQQSLDVLSELFDCVSVNGYSKLFCIAGSVTNYEP